MSEIEWCTLEKALLVLVLIAAVNTLVMAGYKLLDKDGKSSRAVAPDVFYLLDVQRSNLPAVVYAICGAAGVAYSILLLLKKFDKCS